MNGIPRRRFLATIAAGLALRPWRAVALSAPVRCGILDGPPWALPGEEPPGIGVEMVAWMAERTGIPMQARPVPAARLVEEFQKGIVQAAIFLRHPELDAAGRRLGVAGPIDLLVFCRKGFRCDSVEDVRNAHLGVTRGGVALEVLGGVMPRRVESLKDLERGIAMLSAGRIDGLLATDIAFDWQRRRMGLRPNDFGMPLRLARVPLEVYGHASLSADILDRLAMIMPGAPDHSARVLKRYGDA